MSLLDVGGTAPAFGAFFGLTLHAKLYPRLCTHQLADERWWKPFARFAVSVLLCSPLVLLFFLDVNMIHNMYVLMAL